MITLLQLLLLLMVVVANEVAERCQQPQCEECKVMVEQEKTDLVVVDWSQAWWDLDLDCLDTLTVRLNGVSHLVSGLDVKRERLSLPVLPCVEYEVKVLAEMKDNTFIESSPMTMMTRKQPEFTRDILSQIEVVRARSEGGVELRVSGLWSHLLADRDCRAPQQAFIMLRPGTEAERLEAGWEKQELDLSSESLNARIQLSEYCLDHQLQLSVVGFPGTQPATIDLTELLSDTEEMETEPQLTSLPTVPGLVVRVTGSGAEISWQNSSCLPGFEVLVARENSCDAACLSNNQTEAESLPPAGASLEVDRLYQSWQQPESVLTVSQLVPCEDYVVMVRLVSRAGLAGPVTSQVFRPQPHTQPERLTTFSHQKWLPPVTSLRVVAGVSSATVQWVQPGCMSEYEMLVLEAGDQCGESYQCLQSHHHNITRATQEGGGQVSVKRDNLESCRQYRVIVRSKGGPKFGAVSEVLFWSLPSLGSPFSLVSFTVRSAAHQLELRWRHEHVVCIGTYIVKACSQAQGGVCETNIVNTDNKRGDVMLAKIQNLTPCSNYSLEIGVGPFVYRDSTRTSFSDEDQEESLIQVINQVWASQENAFKAFAITAPAEYRPAANLALETTWTTVSLTWDPVPCAQHYVLVLRTLRSPAHVRLGPRINDDEDYDSAELGETGIGDSTSASVSVEDLDYYGDDFSGDSADYQIESNNSMRKRSTDDYDQIYSLFPQKDDLSTSDDNNQDDVFVYLDEEYDPEKSIEDLLGLDDEESPPASRWRSEVVTGSRGEMTGLEPCTDYGLTLVTVFPHNINVTSQEEIFRTPCSPDCPSNTTDLVLEVSEDTSLTSTARGQPGVWVEILTPADCLSGSSYVLTVCLDGEGHCERSEPFQNVNQKIEITHLRGLSHLHLQPCTSYTFTLSLITGQTVLKKSLYIESRHDLNVKPPGRDAVSIENLSDGTVRLDFVRGSRCVRGYDVIFYEMRHLPSLARQYIEPADQPRLHQQSLSWDETELEIAGLKPGGQFRVEMRNIYLNKTMSHPLELYVQTPCNEADTYPEVLTEKEVKVERMEGNNSVIFQFSSRCVSGYELIVCPHSYNQHHHQACQTFSIPSSEEGQRRGFYQELVSQLPSCSVLSWELTSTGPLSSLYQNYLLTGTAEPLHHHSQPFSLLNAEVKTGEGRVLLSWDISQPCVLQYNLTVCPTRVEEEEQLCWSGTFARPDIESEEDFKFIIDLTAVRAFHSISLTECGHYQVRVEPGTEAGLEGEVILPFTFINSVQPPATATIQNVTETSALVSWSHSACSNSEQVLILVSQEGEQVLQLQPRPGHTAQLIEGLQPCSDYLLEIFGLEAELRSDRAQMMFLITRPHFTSPVRLEAGEDTLSLNLETDWSGCVEEVSLTACEAGGEECQELEEKCDEVSVSANSSQLVLEDRAGNTGYGVSVMVRYHDNSTQTISQQCLRTKVGVSVRLELQPVVVSHQMLKFRLNFSLIAQIPERENISVWCRAEAGEEEEEELVVTDNYEVVLDKVRPDTEYLCQGQVSLTGEIIEIPQTVVSTDCDVRAELEVTEITADSFRLSLSSNCGEVERWELKIQESCQPSSSCHLCQLELTQSLAGSERSYRHWARPGGRYTVSVSPPVSSLHSPVNTTVVVDTLPGPPQPPTIESVEATGPDSLRVKFSSPCPLTGPTAFSLLTECQPRESCPHNKQQTTELTDQRTFQVSGLLPNISYRLTVEAVVKDCAGKEDCTASSPPHYHSLPCPPPGCHLQKKEDQEDQEEEKKEKEDCGGWECESGFCIAASGRCDGVVQCSDSSDEAGCPSCQPHQFRCVRDGQCLEAARVCDHHLDCWDGSDETNCGYRESLCWPGGFLCLDGGCVDLSDRCDGVWHCSHGEDEQQCGGCGLEQWRCRDGGCIERARLCDEVTDCDDRSDEWSHCHCHTRGLANCPTSPQCLASHSLCDGREDCEDGSDELNCLNTTTTTTTTTTTEKLTTNSNYERLEKVPSSDDYYESDEKYPDFPLELLPSPSSTDQFRGFKPLSLTKNTKKPSKSRKPQRKEKEGNDRKFFSNEVEPAGARAGAELSEVRVKVYPSQQRVEPGQDVVIQCRDEGDLRTPVTWTRVGRGGELPVNSGQEKGRLEVYSVREDDGGEYTCTSLSLPEAPGGSQTSRIVVLTPNIVP